VTGDGAHIGTRCQDMKKSIVGYKVVCCRKAAVQESGEPLCESTKGVGPYRKARREYCTVMKRRETFMSWTLGQRVKSRRKYGGPHLVTRVVRRERKDGVRGWRY